MSDWFDLRQLVATRVNALTDFATVVSNIPTIDRAELTAPKFLIVPADGEVTFRNRGDNPKTLAVFIALFAPLGADADDWDNEADEYLTVMEIVIESMMADAFTGWRVVEMQWPTPISEERWRQYSQFTSILRVSFEEL